VSTPLRYWTLPCSAIVHEDHGKTTVSVVDPLAVVDILGNPSLRPVAEEAKAKLKRVLDAMANRRT
jgi:hypothetical protein